MSESLRNALDNLNTYYKEYENHDDILDCHIKNKDYYITGEFYKNYLEKLKQNRKCKKYLVKLPSGEIKEVINLDKFARENNLTSGTLHATYIKKKKTKGYQVIKRM